jgi:lysophospholipase L1-like esterase
MMRMLDRPDVEVVNTAHAGAPLWEQVASWNVTVAPHLARATGVKIVFGMGGYNDSSRDHASLDQIVATYRLESELAHAAGARFVGGLDVIRFDGGDGRQNALIQAVNAALRQADFCDALVDFAAEPMFDRAQGPYPRPVFAEDRVHLSGEGQRWMARMALPVFRTLLNG